MRFFRVFFFYSFIRSFVRCSLFSAVLRYLYLDMKYSASGKKHNAYMQHSRRARELEREREYLKKCTKMSFIHSFYHIPFSCNRNYITEN